MEEWCEMRLPGGPKIPGKFLEVQTKPGDVFRRDGSVKDVPNRFGRAQKSQKGCEKSKIDLFECFPSSKR